MSNLTKGQHWAIRIACAIAFVVILPAACAVYSDQSDRISRVPLRPPIIGGLTVYTDPETGCQYLRPEQRDGLTPRLLPDGTQMCGTVIRKQREDTSL